MTADTLSPAIPDDIEERTEDILKRLDQAGQTVATAESCTGGLLASLFTDVEGLGHCFDRGFITYSDRSKTDLLGVSPDLLESHGAVSRPVAIAMAEGARQRARCDVALAVTGFAGKAGPDDEPGLVHIACATAAGVTHRECHFGDCGRGQVRLGCLRTSLDLLSAAVGGEATA